MLSRRAFVLGGPATAATCGAGDIAAVSAAVFPGKDRLGRAPGRCDVRFDAGAEPGTVRRASFRSIARGREVEWLLVLPPGHQTALTLPLVLVLHGRGGRASSAVDELHLDRYVAALSRPLALAAVDRGDRRRARRVREQRPLPAATHRYLAAAALGPAAASPAAATTAASGRARRRPGWPISPSTCDLGPRRCPAVGSVDVLLRRLARLVLVVSLLASAGACSRGAKAGDGVTSPPSTSKK